MRTSRRLASIALALSLAGTACGGDAPETIASTETSSATDAAEQLSDYAVAVDSSEQDQPAEDTAPDTTTTTTTVDSEQTSVPEDDVPENEGPTCDAPASELRWVDVALDDPDGGLNVRVNAGASNSIASVLPRSSEVVVTGDCVPTGGADWWEVDPTEAGKDAGWVNSEFLSDVPVFNPGLGKAINDADNAGLTAETLDELIEKLADEYGFDEDRMITPIGEPEIADAVGGAAVWEITGLKDDSSNGFRIEIGFHFLKDDNAENVIGFEAKRITNQALCSRGVSEDGRCI